MNTKLTEKLKNIYDTDNIKVYGQYYDDYNCGGQRALINDELFSIHEYLYSEKEPELEGQFSLFDMNECKELKPSDEWSVRLRAAGVLGITDYGMDRVNLIRDWYELLKDEILKAKEFAENDFAGAVFVMNAIVANILSELGDHYGFIVAVENFKYKIVNLNDNTVRIHGVRFEDILTSVNDMTLKASDDYIRTVDRFIKAVTGLEYYSDDYELFSESFDGSDDERRTFVDSVIRPFSELLSNTTTDAIEKETERRVQSERYQSLIESHELLHKEHEVQNEKLESIEKKIDMISSKIDGIQSVASELLSKAESFEEQEKIYSSCTDACVKSVLNEYDNKHDEDSDLFKAEEDYLKNLFGEVWDKKLDNLSKVCLHTAKVMFKQTLLIDKTKSLEYSGVCVLMTKSLEIEMKKRFYDGFLEYLRKNDYHISEYPSYLITKDNRGGFKVKKETQFTLGNIPYIFAYKEDYKNRQKAVIDNEMLYKYVKKELMPEKNTSEIADILKDYGRRIDNIVNNYRNKSAHRGSINYDQVSKCFEIIIDEVKLMKMILETFEK